MRLLAVALLLCAALAGRPSPVCDAASAAETPTLTSVLAEQTEW